jgi:hypothetical protein
MKTFEIIALLRHFLSRVIKPNCSSKTANATIDKEMELRNSVIPSELTAVRYLCPSLVYVLSKFIVR